MLVRNDEIDTHGPTYRIKPSDRKLRLFNDAVHDDTLPREKAALLREIVGNPFRPVKVGDVILDGLKAGHAPCTWIAPEWLTPTVLSLAQAAYDERDKACPYCKDAIFESGDFGTPIMGGKEPYASRAKRYFRSHCACKGTRRVPNDDGTLAPFRVGLVADALEEAGCLDPVLLGHLRGLEAVCTPQGGRYFRSLRGPHVRGCWAIDLILGKEVA